MTNIDWQQLCADTLIVSLSLGGTAGEKNWSDQRQRWVTGKRDRVILKDLDLSHQDLRSYDLSRCWIGDVSFASANLSGVDFSQTIFRGCDFTGANLRGTSFYAADLKHPKNRLIHTNFDGHTNLEINPGMFAPEMEQALMDMAQAAYRRTEWARRRSSSIAFRLLALITDYGFGLLRTVTCALAIILAFSGLFFFLDPDLSLTESGLVSSRYFLGLADSYAETNACLSLIGIIETVLGFLFLAILIAIFTSKFTDL